MKKLAGLLCCMLLLSACGGGAEPGSAPETHTPTVKSPLQPPTPTVSLAAASEPTPAQESIPTLPPEPEPPTLEEARALIERANAAMAPFLGETPMEGEPVDCGWRSGWHRLREYSVKEELLYGLKQVFTDDLAEGFFHRYDRDLFWEADGAVYTSDHNREILGHYYDMDLNTLAFDPSLTAFLFSDVTLTADGYGNGTPVQWLFGLVMEDGAYQVSFYACYGSGKNLAEEPYTVLLDGVPYKMRSDAGSPDWLGEPYRVVERNDGDRITRFEYYPGLKVELHDWEIWWTEVPGLHPASIWVTGPGYPTSRGVEVGDTMREVLAAYPQFDMWGVDSAENAVCQRWHPWGRGEYQGDTIYFEFDENYILETIYYYFDVSE